MHRDGESSAEYKYNGATAATEHASRRREQPRPCIAAAEQRQRQKVRASTNSRTDYALLRRSNSKTEHLHRDGSSRADYARIQRQGQRLHPYGDSRADYATLHPAAKQRQRHIMHRDGESSADYAWIQRSNRSVHASRRPQQAGLSIDTAKQR